MDTEKLKQMLNVCDEIRGLSHRVDAATEQMNAQNKRMANLTRQLASVATLTDDFKKKTQKLDESLAVLRQARSE